MRGMLAFATLTFVAVLCLADDPPVKKPAEEQIPAPKKVDDKLKQPGDDKPPMKPAIDEEAQILERLTKNSKKAEQRLAESDASEPTRKIQQDVLNDIDELIKRLKQPPPPSDQSQSSSSSSSSSSQQQQPKSGASGGGMSRQEQRERRRQQQAKNSRGGQSPMPKSGDPKGQQPMPKPMDGSAQNDPKEGKAGQTAGKPNAKSPKDKDEMMRADLYKDIWGHLPEKMRLEMDSYFKERFMPRYNELLKQYYSTIAEQNKKK